MIFAESSIGQDTIVQYHFIGTENVWGLSSSVKTTYFFIVCLHSTSSVGEQAMPKKLRLLFYNLNLYDFSGIRTNA